MFEKLNHSIEKKIMRLWTEDVAGGWLHTLASGLSWGYAAGVYCHGLIYEKGLKAVKKLPCPVISVGNLVAGGAGKTPMTLYIARQLKGMGYRVVILSRGYKGRYAGPCAVVFDGEHLLLGAAQAGDEPFMMAAMKICPVVVGKERYLAGRQAVEMFRSDVVILDDGFQHRKLYRDLNLLLLDHTRPFGNGRLLPAGRLREPAASGLDRADALIFTRAEGPDPVHKDLPRRDIPWFRCRHRPYLVTGGETAGSLETLTDQRVLLISALADNRGFRKSITQSGANVVEHLEFKDHYGYKEADILAARQRAAQIGAQIILTTRKDWVKMCGFTCAAADIGVVDIDIEFEFAEAFNAFLKERLTI